MKVLAIPTTRAAARAAIIKIQTFFILCLLFVSITACNANHNVANTPTNTALESIPLSLTTHLGYQQNFIEGDELQFLMSLGQDAFIYMYYIDAKDDIKQILPSENQSSNYYSAGYFLTIPNYKKHYRFIIGEPYGDEEIWLLASDQSVILESYDRSIEVIRKKIKQGSTQYYGEYMLPINTQKRYIP